MEVTRDRVELGFVVMLVVSPDSSAVLTSGTFNELLLHDVASVTTRKHEIQDAWVARVIASLGDLAMVQLFDRDPGSNPWFRLLVVEVQKPSQRVASLDLRWPNEVAWEGSNETWQRLPRVFAKSRMIKWDFRNHLVSLGDEPGQVTVISPGLPEAMDDSEVELRTVSTEQDVWLVALRGPFVARLDSSLARVTQIIDLSAPIGDARPRVGPTTTDIWLACYAEVVRLDTLTGQLKRLDVASWRDDSIADIAIGVDASTCAAALYRSGAVMAINVETLDVTHKAETAESLAEIGLLADGRFVAKVWGRDEFVVAPLRQASFRLRT
jgi:hypothetical protein